MTNDVTVVITTYNEEHHIAECLKSALLLTPNILLIDTGSTDHTVEIARSLNIPTFHVSNSQYVEPARTFGIKQASTDWVFILDADERITPELVDEINATVKQTSYTYFKIPRKNIFGKKKWLKHGGWWPDYQIRLINRSAFKVWPAKIHSTPQIEGALGMLQQPFLHYFHGDIEKMVNKTIIFENIESDLLHNAGRASSMPIFFRKFTGELYRRLFKKRGFADGEIGIMESIYQAFSKTITYLYLYEKNHKSGSL